MTSFVGRERELSDIQQLLATFRLVTITGAGGCGKTRLALRVAGSTGGEYPDGVCWVNLAVLNNPEVLSQYILQTLKLSNTGRQPAIDTLLAYLQTKEILLALDNCEHLIEGCARLVDTLLSQTTELRILATSRESLGIDGERLYPLLGLEFPPLKASITPQELITYDAPRLFVDRVTGLLPGFTATPENAAVIAQICRRLDGLPLALELAGARSNVLSLQQIAQRLDDRFELLVSSQRAENQPRHRTLRLAMDWSHDLLAPMEQILLRRLSVFAGGCSLSAVEAVCAGEAINRAEIFDSLSQLVKKSLVVADTIMRSEARYRLLETIREYALGKLDESGEWRVIRDRHLVCFLALVEEVAEKLSGPYQQLWLNWLEIENGNIRQALAWALESRQIEAGLRVCIAIYQFWTVRDYADEGLAWMERLLAGVDGHVDMVIHANGLAYAAFLAGFRGNTAAQATYGEKAAALAEKAGVEGKSALRWALSAQMYGARALGDYETEFALAERVIQLTRESGDRYQLGVILSVSSFSAMALWELHRAREMLDESLSLLREAGNPYRIAMALNFSGDLSRCEQDYPRAKREYTESISLLRQLNAPRDLASALHNLGHASMHLGDAAQARNLFDESLAIQIAQRNMPGLAECLIGYAALAVVCGMPRVCARLLSAATAIGGLRVASMWAATRMEYEYYLAQSRSILPETDFKIEQGAGSALTIEGAIQAAQELPAGLSGTRKKREMPDELTRRELEIVKLIAGGMANGEIAARLVLSKRTVEKHIAHIIMKLGISNRSQIVLWAIETGLVRVAL